MGSPLTEEQIVRFSRQILLRDVGGKGQQRLLEVPVVVEGEGEAAESAREYLEAGGTPVVRTAAVAPSEPAAEYGAAEGTSRATTEPPRENRATGWTPELRPRATPELRLHLAAGMIAVKRPDGCDRCFEAATRAHERALQNRATGDRSSSPVRESSSRNGPTARDRAGASVALGALAALVAQRVVLGLGDDRVALYDVDEGSLELSRRDLPPCEHR